jgi:flagellar basal-body rod protein FlgB
MLISDLTNSGAIPSLEMSLRFAGARQRLIAHNIANVSTPDFRPMDVDPAHFAQVLRGAIEVRRARTGNERGDLRPLMSKQLGVGADGQLRLNPKTPSGNILFHDRNNRDLERLMQDNAENVASYRLSAELLRSRYEILKAAIAERA